MPSVKKPLLHLYLGRHETAASGLWVFNRTFVQHILDALASRKELGRPVPAVLITFGGPLELYDDLVRIVEPLPLETELIAMPITFGSRRFSILADLVRVRHAATLIHGTANSIPFCAGEAKAVLTLHDILQARSPLPAESIYVRVRRLFYKCLLQLQVRSADVVLTGHETTKEGIEALTRSKADVRVIHLPLASSYVSAPLGTYSEGSRILLAFASGDRRKNVDGLIRAFRSWPEHGEWRLKVVSNSPAMTEALRKIAPSLESSGVLEFVEQVPQEDMCRLYKSAHALLFPSLGEGFGYPIYEALSQGVPVMCGKESIISPLVDHAKRAIIECDSLDEQGLLKGLERTARILLSEPERQSMARAVRDYLSPRSATARILAVYEEVAPELFKEF